MADIKIISWNVNGIRACVKSGFHKWFANEDADIVCLQEIKANADQVGDEFSKLKKYQAIWNSAQKPGYSGTAIITKLDPINIEYGLGDPQFDNEGRVMIVKFAKFTLINSYFPNSQRDHARLPFKLEFCRKFLNKAQDLRSRGENVIMCADWNIAHQEIDLRNPKTNHKNAGFLPEERAWMTAFLGKGYVDAFRKFESGGGHYTWWSYRPGVREKNIGWRLDYFVCNEELSDRLKASTHLTKVLGSDHCPVTLTIKN